MSEPYGLSRPTVGDARAAVLRVHGPDGPQVWDRLVRATGTADDLERVLDMMESADPSTRMCGLALRIRLVAHTSLAAAHDAAHPPVVSSPLAPSTSFTPSTSFAPSASFTAGSVGVAGPVAAAGRLAAGPAVAPIPGRS